MNDNDLIRREKLLHTLEGWLKLNDRVVPTEIGKAVYMMIEDYPAVPQEMSAKEYEKVKDRMRRSNGTDNAYGLYVRALFEGQIDEAVAIVEKWAREHPERSEE